MSEKKFPVEKSERISLEISGITHSGQGVGRFRGLAVFVPGAAPGDTVLVEVVEIKKSYARARLLEVTRPSPSRRDPECRRFSACGGCRLQHVSYRDHLIIKTSLVRDSLSRIAGLGPVPVMEALGMDFPWHYRNKAWFQVETGPGGIALGFYREGSHTLEPFFNSGESDPGCLLVDRDLNRLASLVERLMNSHLRSAALPPGQGGFFRGLLLRKAMGTGEIMAVLETGKGEWPGEKAFAGELASLMPGVASVVRIIGPGARGRAPVAENRILAGRGYITDLMGGLTFRISPHSFYQVNPAQTLVLYRKALEYAGLDEGKTPVAVDAYCGIGTIALFMAGRCKKVFGVEEVPGAVADARGNAASNGIDNVEFYLGKVERILPGLASGDFRPGLAVLDPPRGGCRREVLEAVSAMKIPRLVYISCDPGTMARDLGILSGSGYLVEEVQPVDMFPWTHHVECVVLMSRVEK